MNGTDALTAVAEISLGLAGFTGIIMALYSRAESWSQLDAIRALFLLIAGFGALLLSLLPFALHFLGLAESTIWRASSVAMLILSFGYIIVWARFGSHLDWSRIPHNDAMKWFSSIGGIMIMVLQSANVWFAQLGLFFIGLLWLLIIGCVQFAVILYLRPRV
jgi:hypothetical protein